MRGRLERAWLWLAGLSLAATLLALSLPALPEGPARGGVAVLVLAIAGRKADVILSDYLDLREAPHIRRGFRLALVLFLLIAAGLYLAAPGSWR